MQSDRTKELESLVKEYKSLIIGKKGCPSCVKARDFLDSKGIPYIYADHSECISFVDKIRKEKMHKTFPSIFLRGDFVGGYAELKKVNLQRLNLRNRT